jgi:hypothetical protein
MLGACPTPEAAARIAELCWTALIHGGWPLSELEDGSFLIIDRACVGFDL